MIAPGVTTGELDDVAREIIDAEGAVSYFYGHHGFTGRICASINDEIVHGIPGKRSLRMATLFQSTSERLSAVITAIRHGPIQSDRSPKRRLICLR